MYLSCLHVLQGACLELEGIFALLDNLAFDKLFWFSRIYCLIPFLNILMFLYQCSSFVFTASIKLLCSCSPIEGSSTCYNGARSEKVLREDINSSLTIIFRTVELVLLWKQRCCRLARWKRYYL